MKDKMRKAYSEVNEILKLLDKEMVDKIPIQIINFFETECDKGYSPIFDEYMPLEEQHLLSDTKDILALLKLKYWCDENEKTELINILKKNDIEFAKVHEDEYDIEKIIMKKRLNEVKPENRIVEVKKESFIEKFIRNLKKLFNCGR